MRVLFIGGSGIISSACSRLAAERDIDLFVLNRGLSQDDARVGAVMDKLIETYRPR